jgi:hypothetical protein
MVHAASTTAHARACTCMGGSAARRMLQGPHIMRMRAHTASGGGGGRGTTRAHALARWQLRQLGQALQLCCCTQHGIGNGLVDHPHARCHADERPVLVRGAVTLARAHHGMVCLVQSGRRARGASRLVATLVSRRLPLNAPDVPGHAVSQRQAPAGALLLLCCCCCCCCCCDGLRSHRLLRDCWERSWCLRRLLVLLVLLVLLWRLVVGCLWLRRRMCQQLPVSGVHEAPATIARTRRAPLTQQGVCC